MSPPTTHPPHLGPVSPWRLVPGVRVHLRGWEGETAAYFDGAGETMVVNALGATALEGIAAGCSALDILEDWCRSRGWAEAGEELTDGLLALLEQLAALDIIEPPA